MSNSMFICLSLLALFTAVGIVAFMKSLSPRHAFMTAFAYMREQLEGKEFSYENRAMMLCLNNMRHQVTLTTGNAFERAKQKQAWLVKEAVELELTPRQQLALLNSLLDINTNVHQAKKITKVRSVKEIVELAVQYAADNRKVEAPLALFR
ncbi:hypothetical protein AH06_255 [Erwinia phage AH06]|nr:hypothetical protein AH06_255 [Erwinia phage AH06]